MVLSSRNRHFCLKLGLLAAIAAGFFRSFFVGRYPLILLPEAAKASEKRAALIGELREKPNRD